MIAHGAMRMRAFWVLWMAITLGCSTCQFSVGTSREEKVVRLLEDDGLENIELEPTEEKGGYSFTAERGATACTGTVEVDGSDVKWRSDCDGLLPYPRLEEKCTAGDQAACTLVAKALVNGDGVEADVPRSTQLFQKACESGEAMACFYVGLAHARGDRELPQDNQQAYAMYNKACEGDVPEACHNLSAMILDQDSPSEADAARVQSLLEANCNESSQLSCGLLGQALSGGRHMDREPERARQLVSTACAASDLPSCSLLGSMLMDGVGGEADPGQGLIQLTRACNGQMAGACADLGRVYWQGVGVSRQPARAKMFFGKACELGDQRSCEAAARR